MTRRNALRSGLLTYSLVFQLVLLVCLPHFNECLVKSLSRSLSKKFKGFKITRSNSRSSHEEHLSDNENVNKDHDPNLYDLHESLAITTSLRSPGGPSPKAIEAKESDVTSIENDPKPRWEEWEVPAARPLSPNYATSSAGWNSDFLGAYQDYPTNYNYDYETPFYWGQSYTGYDGYPTPSDSYVPHEDSYRPHEDPYQPQEASHDAHEYDPYYYFYRTHVDESPNQPQQMPPSQSDESSSQSHEPQGGQPSQSREGSQLQAPIAAPTTSVDHQNTEDPILKLELPQNHQEFINSIPVISRGLAINGGVNKKIVIPGLVTTSIIKGDGNCQFRALSFLLCGDQDKHVKARKLIVKWLDKNSGHHDSILPETPRKYAKRMWRVNEWGDEITLVAAAARFEKSIIVLSAQPKSTPFFRQYGDSEHKTIALFFRNKHYELLYRDIQDNPT